LGIAHRVSWQGFIDGEQKQIFLNDINVLIMPSDYECFGMAAAEAMIHGTPVITTPNTGIAEVIRAGGGGEIVSAETDTVRAVIEKLANERDKLSELGRQAAENARNSLSFAAYGGAMMRQYETLLTDRKTDRKWNAC
jgi:glycosyltransferase involved in cell wall biosynthesis